MFRDLSANDRATVILALRAWQEQRAERADLLQPFSPMLSLMEREESERTRAILAKVQA